MGRLKVALTLFGIFCIFILSGCGGGGESSGNSGTGLSSAKAITTFSLNGTSGVITGQIITVHMSSDTNLTALIATYTTNGKSVAIRGGTTQTSGVSANDFTKPVDYIVTAADGSTATYTVIVMMASSSAKAITTFSLNGTPGVITGQTISVRMPNNTHDLTALVATFATSGQKVAVLGSPQLSGITPNNFTIPVKYTVTAANGSTTTYTVSTTVASASSKAITAFSLNDTSGVIVGNTITVNMPNNTPDLTALVATYTTSGQNVTVLGVPQTSGATANDFTNSVDYVVAAADGSTTTYTVIVTVAPTSAKAITALSLNGIPGVIIGQNITVTMPNTTTDVTGLIATFTTNGQSVTVLGVPQTNGITANDFTSPVQYIVMAADGSAITYTVVVTVASGSSKTITAFSLNGVPGTITGQSIAVTMPNTTNVTALIASFTTSGVGVSTGGVQQISGTTPNNFTNPVQYVVTAADGSTATYTVTVTVASASDKAITSFSLNGIPGVITDQNITVTMSYTPDVTALIANFTTTGTGVFVGAVQQTSGVTPNNFIAPVSYVVTAADGSRATYTVTINWSQ